MREFLRNAIALLGMFPGNGVLVRPQPDVDSLVPARSALRAFGFAEFLSPIPNRLKSPPGEGTAAGRFLVLRMIVRPMPSRDFQRRWMILPLLGGEGRGEDERQN